MIQALALAGEPRRTGEEGRHVVAKAGTARPVIVLDRA